MKFPLFFSETSRNFLLMTEREIDLPWPGLGWIYGIQWLTSCCLAATLSLLVAPDLSFSPITLSNSLSFSKFVQGLLEVSKSFRQNISKLILNVASEFPRPFPQHLAPRFNKFLFSHPFSRPQKQVADLKEVKNNGHESRVKSIRERFPNYKNITRGS